MSDELLTRVDENDRVIGAVKRSLANHDPQYIFRIVMTYIFSTDLKRILIEQRSFKKEFYPGEWKLAACAGHVGAGEDPLDTMRRELIEELNLKAEPIFYAKNFSKKPTHARFAYEYYLICDQQQFDFDKEEIEQLVWTDISELNTKFTAEKINEVLELIQAISLTKHPVAG